jgi:hypothetical protein
MFCDCVVNVVDKDNFLQDYMVKVCSAKHYAL